MDNSNSSNPEEVSLYNSALDGSSFFLVNDNNSSVNTSSINNDKEKNNSKKIQNDGDKFKQNQKEQQQQNNNKKSINILKNNSSDSLDDNLEVDPKSNLANKTIFKTDNPNLSIIEINDSLTHSDEEESVYLIGSDDDEEHKEKVRSILHSSRQKLNVNTTSATSIVTTTSSIPLTTATKSTSSSISSLPLSSSPSSGTSTSVAHALTTTTTTTTASEAEATTISETEDTDTLPEKRIIKIYDTIEEFENNLPQTVKILTTPYGSKVYLVGTAHFSEESQNDVSYVIRNVKPDIVMVELCTSRIHILKHDEKSLLEEAKSLNFTKIRNIIKTNGVMIGVFYILLLHMSAQVAKEIGMAPGGEFRRAFDEAQKLRRCTLHLGDRPINITLQRALRALPLWQTIKLICRLTFSSESINIEEVEECKQQDLLEKLLQEMAGEFPAFSDVFVTERDLYLCYSLQSAAQASIRPVTVVGVVGIGHTAGICKNWLQVEQSKILEILEIPPASLSTRIFKYTIKYGFYGLLTFGVIKFLRPRFQKF